MTLSGMLAAADIALTVLHAAVVLFVLFGWLAPAWRRLHLLVVGLTFASWLLLGAWYGWGYCFLTDWAWRVKHARGERNLPASFIEWMLERLTGTDWPGAWVDALTLAGALLALGLSLWLNFRRRVLFG